jgi:hypothetical protein
MMSFGIYGDIAARDIKLYNGVAEHAGIKRKFFLFPGHADILSHKKQLFTIFRQAPFNIQNIRTAHADCFFSDLFSKISSSDFNFSFNHAKLRSRELHATNLQSFRQETERNPWFS